MADSELKKSGASPYLPAEYCHRCDGDLPPGNPIEVCDGCIKALDEERRYDRLFAHVGHRIEARIWGNGYAVGVECIDCDSVLISADRPIK